MPSGPALQVGYFRPVLSVLTSYLNWRCGPSCCPEQYCLLKTPRWGTAEGSPSRTQGTCRSAGGVSTPSHPRSIIWQGNSFLHRCPCPFYIWLHLHYSLGIWGTDEPLLQCDLHFMHSLIKRKSRFPDVQFKVTFVMSHLIGRAAVWAMV